jgi:hypothetical protein
MAKQTVTVVRSTEDDEYVRVFKGNEKKAYKIIQNEIAGDPDIDEDLVESIMDSYLFDEVELQ